MGRLKFGRGAVTVTLDDGIQRKVEEIVRRSVPQTMAYFERVAEEIGSKAKAAWPEKTGDSKRAFEWGVRLVSLDRVEAYIRNNHTKDGFPYPYSVRSYHVEGRGPAWSILVRRPAKKRTKKLPDDVVAEIAKLLE